VEPEKT